MIDLGEKLLRKWREAQLMQAARGILDTPPVRPADDGIVLFSMIGTKVLLPYLVAAKSFQAQLGRGRFAILDDGTLTPADKAVLAHHLGDPPITPIASVDTGPCPRGGTWERLLTILDLRRENYVIQLDSDIVATGAVPEVRSAIDAGRSFTLRGEASAEVIAVAEVPRRTEIHRASGRVHVQSLIEQAMSDVAIAGRPDLAYVRGCSGFAGFSPSNEGRALAEGFSSEAERLLGAARWAEWGSEQVTSNFIIANEPRHELLPYTRYLNFWNEPVPQDAALVHFIGTFRYHRGAYRGAVQQAIARLLL